MLGSDVEGAACCQGENSVAEEARVASDEGTYPYNENGNGKDDGIEIPRVGMEFSSKEEAYNF